MNCEDMIYQDDFVDLIVNNYGDNSLRQNVLLDGCVNELIERIAIYHGPRTAQYLTNLETIPYSSIPKLFGLMDTSNLESIGVRQVQNTSDLGLNGTGTIVGIIDTGIAFDNPLFFDSNGQSRIGVIWDQTIQKGKDNSSAIETLVNAEVEGAYPKPIYGTAYFNEEINQALKEEDPYRLVPSRDENGHGTFLAGIAAGGRDETQKFSGIATEAELAVVRLKEAKPYLREYFQIALDVPAYAETDILYGIQYLVNYARTRRKLISILIGVGSSNGGHRGLTYLEIYLARLLENVGVLVSAPAGNEGVSRLHYSGKMDRQQRIQTVEFNVAEKQAGVSMELWGEAPSTFGVGLISPRGEVIDQIPPRFGKEEEVSLPLSRSSVYIAYQLVEAYSGDALIFIRIRNPTAGIWRLQVYSEEDNEKIFNIWMPLRQFMENDTFFLDSNPDNTITSPGNAALVLTMTAYNHQTGSLFLDASRGYTTSNQIKPDLASPGVDIMGPGLRKNYIRKSGTSVAAAHGAGVGALFLQWGLENYPQEEFFTGQIKSLFLRAAKRGENRIYPNPAWGYGIIDIAQTLDMFRVVNYLNRDWRRS